MKFKLSQYIIPSVISMVLVGTYTNIDGFFIGQVTGDDGLAAINIVWPIVACITSLGTGIGVGGSVLLNKAKGRKEDDIAESIKKTMVVLLFFAGIAVSILFILIAGTLLYRMGARGRVYTYALDYAEIICAGAVFQIMSSGLVALLRNEHKTYFSMVCCIAGLLVHLILDVLLAEKYGLSGVAIATVVSQAVMMIMCLSVVKWKSGTKIKREHLIPILVCTTSPFGINFVPSVVLLLTNYFALQSGGIAAVSAYAVMSYAVYTIDYVFQGVCDGIQPILSFYSGNGEKKIQDRVLKQSAVILAVFAILFVCATPALIAGMPVLFSVSQEAGRMMRMGFIIYAFSYPFKAIVKLVSSYFYACGKTGRANFLIYADPIFFTPLLLIILANTMGIKGIWMSFTLTQILVAVLGLMSLVSERKRKTSVL